MEYCNHPFLLLPQECDVVNLLKLHNLTGINSTNQQILKCLKAGEITKKDNYTACICYLKK